MPPKFGYTHVEPEEPHNHVVEWSFSSLTEAEARLIQEMFESIRANMTIKGTIEHLVVQANPLRRG